jgi:hypothetical protein
LQKLGSAQQGLPILQQSCRSELLKIFSFGISSWVTREKAENEEGNEKQNNNVNSDFEGFHRNPEGLCKWTVRFSYKTEQFFYHSSIGSPKIRVIGFWSARESKARFRSANLDLQIDLQNLNRVLLVTIFMNLRLIRLT